jgi:hypothetical protein
MVTLGPSNPSLVSLFLLSIAADLWGLNLVGTNTNEAIQICSNMITLEDFLRLFIFVTKNSYKFGLTCCP